MADFINFEADIEGDDEEIGEEDDEVSNISDVDSENSFIDNQEVKTDVSFYRHFANVENDIDQVLKDAYNEALEDIDKFDEISNLCEGSEEEAEIDDFKNFEFNIKKFNESLFPRIDVDHDRSYYECQYNYATKLQFVCRWKQNHGFAGCAKKREAICDDKLVNFFKDKEHKNCICSKD